MSELQSPLDAIVSRNLNIGESHTSQQTQQDSTTQTLIEALASTGSKANQDQATDDFSWARETQSVPQDSNSFDFEDLKSKGVDEKTLAFLRDSQQNHIPQAKQAQADDTQSKTKLVIPNLDPNKIVENLDLTDLYDVNKYVEHLTDKVKHDPVQVQLGEDITSSLQEAGLDYIPGLIQHFSQQAVIKAVQLAMSEMTGVLPKALGKFSTGLSTGLGDSSYQAQVLSAFSNELEVMIAKTYIPKYKKAFPNADPSDAAKAIREYIDTKGGTIKKEDETKPKEATANPWFSI